MPALSDAFTKLPRPRITEPPVPAIQRWGRIVRWIENHLVLIFSFGLTVILAVALISMMCAGWDQQPPAVHVLMIVPITMWMLLDIPHVMFLLDGGARRSAHLALAVAEKMPVLPWLLRPLVAGWWLMHFAFGLCVALMLAASESFTHSGAELAIRFVLASSLGFAANGYLVLAAAALTRSETIRHWTWRFRLAIDVGVGLVGAFGSTLFPLFVHRH
jgi:hypothetical protein